MSEFHFIRPWWFIALLPLILMLWQLNRQKLSNSGWQKIIPQHLVNHLIQGDDASRHQPFWLLAIGWLIAVVALAGPTWEKLPQPVYQTNTGKVLLMDMSQSMRATDLTPNRLTKARFKAIDLIAKIDDSDMGLVAYSGDAFVISPLTADSKNLTALIPSLSPEIMPVSGSNPLAGLVMADELLKNAGYAKGEIFMLTDGIDQQDIKEVKAFLRASKHRVSILGVGTAEGAPIKQTSGELLKDNYGSIIIPKLNDTSLRGVARATGGVYSRITSTDIDIETMAKQEILSREAKKDDNQLHQGDQFKEFGPYLVMLLLPFAAYAFRRGLVVCVVLGLTTLMSQPVIADTEPPQTAQSSAPSWWRDLWQTKDQQAQQHYSSENYADAAQMFEDDQWRGSSLYKSGDYEGALNEYQKSDSADALYNQGNAHAKMQNFDEAIKAYEDALAKAPDMEDAQKNLDLLKQLKEQQQQQDQQGENNEQQDQQNQEQQDQQNQQGGQQDSEQEQQDQQGEQQDSEQEQQQDGDKPEPRESQQGKEGEDDPQSREDQAEQEQQEQQQEQQAKPGEEKEDQEGQAQQQQQLKPSDQEPTTEEKEQMQEIQQLIRKIPDDPSILLRNKMRLEYQKRKHQNASPPGAKSW